MSTYFMSLNRSKQSITCDFKSIEGKEIMLKLIANSDIFVQNFIPRVVESLGLDYETVKEINPKLIYASIAGYPHNTHL